MTYEEANERIAMLRQRLEALKSRIGMQQPAYQPPSLIDVGEPPTQAVPDQAGQFNMLQGGLGEHIATLGQKVFPPWQPTGWSERARKVGAPAVAEPMGGQFGSELAGGAGRLGFGMAAWHADLITNPAKAVNDLVAGVKQGAVKWDELAKAVAGDKKLREDFKQAVKTQPVETIGELGMPVMALLGLRGLGKMSAAKLGIRPSEGGAWHIPPTEPTVETIGAAIQTKSPRLKKAAGTKEPWEMTRQQFLKVDEATEMIHQLEWMTKEYPDISIELGGSTVGTGKKGLKAKPTDYDIVFRVPDEIYFSETHPFWQAANGLAMQEGIDVWIQSKYELSQLHYGKEPISDRLSTPGKRLSVAEGSIPIDQIDRHRLFVIEAITKNKVIPPEVLKDYPDLVQQSRLSPTAAELPTTVQMEAGGLSRFGDMLDRKLTNDPMTSIEKTGQEAVSQRAGDLAVARHEAHLFAEAMRKDLTRQEREDMIFVRQKTANAFMKNDTAGKAEARLSSKAKEYIKDIDKRIAATWKELVDLGIYDNKQWIADYIHQAWDMPKKKAQQIASGFKTRPPAGRKIESYFEGITEQGYKPRFTDITDLLEYQEGLLNYVKYNRRLVTQLRKWKDPDTGQRLLMLASEKKVPESYKIIDSEPLARAVKPGYPASEGEGWIAPRGVKVAVHPELYNEMRLVFDRPYTGKIGNAVDWFNAIAKKTALSVSLFHHLALSESAGAVGGGVLGMLTAPYPKALKGYRMLRDPMFYEEPLRAGLQVGSTGDINLTKINRMFSAAVRETKGVPGVHQAVKAFQTLNRLWDKGLWDYYHNGLKIYYYWATKERLLRKNPDINPAIVSQESAKVMNDAFGGLEERVFGSPRTRRALQRIFLAPDWTLANIRIATRAFESEKGARARATLLGKSEAMKTELGHRARLRGQIGRRYAFNMALQWFVVTQGINLAFTGKPTWDNEPGHDYDINIGKDKNGRNMYIQMFKQAREPFRYIVDIAKEPLRPDIVMYKLSPIVHTLTEQVLGETTTGWKMPWTKQYPWDRELTGVEELKARAQAIGEKAVPFSARRVIPGMAKEPMPWHFAGLPFPVSGGMTKAKFLRFYSDAYKERDIELMAKLIRAARDNGLTDIDKLVSRAESMSKQQ